MKRVDNTVVLFIIVRNPTYYFNILRNHCMASYVQTSKISSNPQLSYNNLSIRVVIAIQYFLRPWTVTFLSSPWHTHLRTTIQIRISSVDFNHSLHIYLLHSPTPLEYNLHSSLSRNWVIATLTLTITLTLFDRDALWKSGCRNP